MKRRDVDQAQNGEAREQGRPEQTNAKTAKVDHEAENPGEAPALMMTKPGCVNFNHTRGPERLEVTVNAPDCDEQTEAAGKRGGPEKDVHQNSPRGANEHGPFASNAVSN